MKSSKDKPQGKKTSQPQATPPAQPHLQQSASHQLVFPSVMQQSQYPTFLNQNQPYSMDPSAVRGLLLGTYQQEATPAMYGADTASAQTMPMPTQFRGSSTPATTVKEESSSKTNRHSLKRAISSEDEEDEDDDHDDAHDEDGLGVESRVNDEEKKMKRLIKNRESAQQSRIRKKSYVDDLEKQTSELSSMTSEMQTRVSTLIAENQLLKDQLSYLRNVIAPFACPTPVASTYTQHPNMSPVSQQMLNPQLLASLAAPGLNQPLINPAQPTPTGPSLGAHSSSSPHGSIGEAIANRTGVQQTPVTNSPLASTLATQSLMPKDSQYGVSSMSNPLLHTDLSPTMPRLNQSIPQSQPQMQPQLHSQLHPQLYSQLQSQLQNQLQSQLQSQIYQQAQSHSPIPHSTLSALAAQLGQAQQPPLPYGIPPQLLALIQQQQQQQPPLPNSKKPPPS